LDESATDELIDFLLSGNYALGDAAFQRRNSAGQRDGLLSQEWEQAIERKWKDMSVIERNRLIKVKNPRASDVPDIRIWSLPEFQRIP
jgi:hypothetical protein